VPCGQLLWPLQLARAPKARRRASGLAAHLALWVGVSVQSDWKKSDVPRVRACLTRARVAEITL